MGVCDIIEGIGLFVHEFTLPIRTKGVLYKGVTSFYICGFHTSYKELAVS